MNATVSFVLHQQTMAVEPASWLTLYTAAAREWSEQSCSLLHKYKAYSQSHILAISHGQRHNKEVCTSNKQKHSDWGNVQMACEQLLRMLIYCYAFVFDLIQQHFFGRIYCMLTITACNKTRNLFQRKYIQLSCFQRAFRLKITRKNFYDPKNCWLRTQTDNFAGKRANNIYERPKSNFAAHGDGSNDFCSLALRRLP